MRMCSPSSSAAAAALRLIFGRLSLVCVLFRRAELPRSLHGGPINSHKSSALAEQGAALLARLQRHQQHERTVARSQLSNCSLD